MNPGSVYQSACDEAESDLYDSIRSAGQEVRKGHGQVAVLLAATAFLER